MEGTENLETKGVEQVGNRDGVSPSQPARERRAS